MPARSISKRIVLCVLLVLAVAVLSAAFLVSGGYADLWARRAVLSRLEKMTGTRAEIGAFHFHWFGLEAEIDDLTLHGFEPANTPPLFHAARLSARIRIDSFWGRKVSLDEVRVDGPRIHIRTEADGRTNVPGPRSAIPSGMPGTDRLFNLAVRQVRLVDGVVAWNDVEWPLAIEGGNLNLSLDYHASAEGQFYIGRLAWQQVLLVARRYLPFSSDLAVRFTLGRNYFRVEQFEWKLPHSRLDAQASVANFVAPSWQFRYRGTLDFEDIRAILRKPRFPSGTVEAAGEGSYAGKHLVLGGRYRAQQIAISDPWFHAAGISSRGTYTADERRLQSPDFEASVFGGAVRGPVKLRFDGLNFRAETEEHGLSLAAILTAVDHRDLPVASLHWEAEVAGRTITTWVADFKHLDARGESVWDFPKQLHQGEIPVSARLGFHYNMDGARLTVEPSEISTSASRIAFSGSLGARDSALEAQFDTDELSLFNDFIARIRGAGTEAETVAGRFHWQGRLVGPLARPTFAGQLKGAKVRYGGLAWDEIEGDLSYSANEFRLARGKVRRGSARADLELTLELDQWSFRSNNAWTLEANLARAPTDDLQSLLGWSYPVRGVLTGQFRGRGTRRQPELTGLFDLSEIEAWGYHFDRARGQINLRPEEIRVSNAELRLFVASPQSNSTRGGTLTGNFLYRTDTQEVAFDVTGAVLPLERFQRIQTARFPLGGAVSFQWSGRGPLRSPISQGSWRIVDLKVGGELLGSFEGKLNSDGRHVHLDLNSAMTSGSLSGQLDCTLGGDYPFEGQATVSAIDLDPFIKPVFHLRQLTGHSKVDGRFVLSGAWAHPQGITVAADITRIQFDYEYVKLENVSPLRLIYHSDEVRIEPVSFHGAATDFRISGTARFAGDRRLNLSVDGTLDLRLLGEVVPAVEARGPAQVNVSIAGTIASPRITGKMHVEEASASYGDFPAGLSHVKGDFVFDTSRLLFENVTGETGGGQLVLGGSVTYGDPPLRYDVTARTSPVRLRYPEGMSWLATGTLRLTGTTQTGLLSGRVVVERLLMSEGFDLATLILFSKEGARGPSTTSLYLRNLQFDIEGVSSPGARMEWSGAQVITDTNLRLRGTWEHPILLGYIHLLGGEMSFRGTRYRLSRGDINFANPFRFDPVLSVEATTTIRQYEVTVEFTGPASRLSLAYRSDPPLPANDIIALLTLGQTTEESRLRASPTGTTDLGARALLSEAISSQLGGRIERLFGISRFRVDPFLAGTGAEQNAAARITIEQQVTRDLTITYISNVTSSQQQVIQVEYNVRRNLSIIALRDQNGTFGLDVKLKKRFK